MKFKPEKNRLKPIKPEKYIGKNWANEKAHKKRDRRLYLQKLENKMNEIILK